MKLNARDAQVLDFLWGRKASMKEISQGLGIRKSNLTRYVAKLYGMSLISIERKGKRKELSLDSQISSGFSTLKSRFPMLRMEDILTGRCPYFLAFLKSRTTFMAKDIDLPNITSIRILKKLRSLGIVSMIKKGEYHLRQEAEIIPDFCQSVIARIHSTDAQKELGFIERVIFSFDSAKDVEAIFITRQEAKAKHYWPTAYSLTHEFGLPLIQAGKYYYVNVKPDLRDMLIHMLAVSRDTRTILYVSAIAAKNKLDANLLVKKKQRFGLDPGFLKGLADFIKSKGLIPFSGLSSFKEVEEMLHG